MWSKIFGRKSTKNISQRSIQHKSKPLKPEDFDDVFGGPPRCLHFHPSDYFYENMFQNPVRQCVEEGVHTVQDLPEFKISLAGGLNRKIFSRDFIEKDVDEVPRSKLNWSSISNSEELSPFQHPISENDVSRRINVQPTWNNTSEVLMQGVQQKHEEMPDFTYNPLVGKQITDNAISKKKKKKITDNEQQAENFRTSILFSFSRRASSPQRMSPGAYSYSSVKVSVGDEDGYTNKFHKDDDDDDDDNEISGSYFFEINSCHREGTDEGLSVDEAIAWAKKSYQSHSSSAKMPEKSDGRVDGSKSLHLQGREMELLEEDIKLWSCGKERNIGLLISTLQDILWPNSGWCPIPSMKLYESSDVKKAYQKARLCLHPDKLQQRGATLLQKYVAERIFLILQEAWAAYISQDIIILS